MNENVEKSTNPSWTMVFNKDVSCFQLYFAQS